MTIEEQLRQEILKNYRSIRAFANEVGISYSTLDSALKRGISNAGVSSMIKVFTALGLNIENIAKGDLFFEENEEASPEPDEALLNLFHQLNEEGQEQLLDYADTLVTSGKFAKKSDAGQMASEV